MKVGIDFDDTITELPWLFAALSVALKGAGHQVHIITYRDEAERAETENELRTAGIQYDQLHLPDGDVLAPEWKSDVAAALQLDVMFDASPEVLANMPATTKRLWLCDPEVFDLGVCIKAFKKENLTGPRSR